MRNILIVLLATMVLVAYLAFAPYVLEYGRYLVRYVRLVSSAWRPMHSSCTVKEERR